MSIPDNLIKRLMLEAGHVPGEQMTQPVIRRYSELLVEWARRQDEPPSSD